jgi:uncharacterized protein YqjF (DUF2071 family)
LNGIPIPFHAVFEEVNLRFYVVRHEDDISKRGVVFIREFVPKPAVTLVANKIFREHYESLPMKHIWLEQNHQQHIAYSWKKKDWNTFTITSNMICNPLVSGSKEGFFTEHYWGYTQIGHQKTLEYFVNHHPWETYDTLSYQIDVDFEVCYGKPFAFLAKHKPESVFLAEGSGMSLEKRKKITPIISK